LDKNQSLNKDPDKFFDRRLKILFSVAFLIVVWIIVIHFFSEHIKTSFAEEWNTIAGEKTLAQSKVVTDLFGDYQNELNSLSERLTTNPDIMKQVQRSDPKKLFEELLKFNPDNSYQVEIYNTRLELLAFEGRKLESDVYSLQRCAGGKKFSIIKEVGFYTYLIIYTPVYDPKDKQQITGIILAAKLIDIKYQINNKFFQNIGILNDISKSLGVTTEIIPANNISGKIDFDSTRLSEDVSVPLNGLDQSVIGVLLLPKYSEITHTQNIDTLSRTSISLLVFGFTILFFLICYKFLLKIHSSFLRFVFFICCLIAIRFLWLEFFFPSKTISSEIFSPGFYASTFGWGVAKSLGEFLITSVFVLAIALYGISLITVNRVRPAQGKILTYIKDALPVFCFFVLLYLYGSVIQSIVFDSNLKFFDRSNIIPGMELFIIQLTILILTFSLFLFLISLIIFISKNHSREIFGSRLFRNYSFLALILLLIGINWFFASYFDEFRIENIFRILIIVFSVLMGIYLSRNILFFNGRTIFSIKNFSIIILFCIITVPGILLDKITSQETHFVELIGRKITEKDDDRIKFLLTTELSNFSENKKIETNLKNKSKLTELAFSIWADSKFSAENYNTAIILLDTNQKLLSDFIFNSQTLDPDSIIKYADKNFFIKKKILEIPADTLEFTDSSDVGEILEEEEEFSPGESSAEDISSLYITDKILILKNEKEKYYLGIVPIEKVGLRNTSFETNLGYLLIAVQYESKNFLVQSSLQLFKNYSRDNLYDKLISSPIITEYVAGEIVSSNNQDLSKANNFSIDAFREAIKFKDEKFDWRYEVINNERYRTLYIMASPEELTGNERIFSISLRRNDFKLTVFFYLKFILFVVFVYLFILSIFSILLVFRLRKFSLNFREKLFASFFIVSVIPIVFLAIYTRSFIKNKYDQNFQNEIISDLNLVSQSLKASKLNIAYSDSLSKEQNSLLTRSLNQTDKNFNLFLRTKLASTTDEELYKSDLLDTRVNAEAYYNIVYLRKDFFSRTEQIGVYSFIVGYKPFFDQNNNIIGLISSQTVYKQTEINEELTEILTFIFGIYFIVIILLLVLVTYLTDRISKPILKLQNATERISKGETNVELTVNRKDEIGNLVESFNKMSKELESSKDKLKKAEREAAWRDIARRVAHEIKNPLTPMKLSIQHLEEVYQNGNSLSFPEVLKKTRTIIINEIDKLNKIATEFSDFAKLPDKNYERTDLNEVIGEVISLYKLSPDIEFRESLDINIPRIFADRQELNRAFQNLIKNSIQAIETNGVIDLKTYMTDDGSVYAEVIDNGSGIDKTILSNLFEPNFSTKSTGMGLGLAITKKTLDDMKAEIKLENNSDGKGTRAIIKFSAYNFEPNGIKS